MFDGKQASAFLFGLLPPRRIEDFRKVKSARRSVAQSASSRPAGHRRSKKGAKVDTLAAIKTISEFFESTKPEHVQTSAGISEATTGKSFRWSRPTAIA